jgi:hypothetical protein
MAESNKSQVRRVREHAEFVYDGLPDYPDLFFIIGNDVIIPCKSEEDAWERVESHYDYVYKVTRVAGVTTVTFIC